MTGGETIPLDHAGAFPTTEQTLASVSTLLGGGGIGQINDITTALNGALSGHESQVRHLLGQLDEFTAALDRQRNDIIAAADGLDRLSGTVNRQESSLQRALDTIPQALRVLDEQQQQLAAAITSVGGFATTAHHVVRESFSGIVHNLQSLHPALKGLADAGSSLTRGLPALVTPPFPMENVSKFLRGDYANLSATIDLTLGRIDNSLLVGTPQEGSLAALERAMGRTEGSAPSSKTTNPLTAPLSTVVQRGG
jgi:phospholipid/cholesterol/gamma-HCH transport system substrate-binding protein